MKDLKITCIYTLYMKSGIRTKEVVSSPAIVSSV